MGLEEPNISRNSESHSPLPGMVGDPSALIDLSIYRPQPPVGPQEMIERGIAEGRLPRNLKADLKNPIIERAAVVYLARYDDVVPNRDFESRFTAIVLEAARVVRSTEANPQVDRVLDLLDSGFLSPAEAEEAITYPHRLTAIEQGANARLLEPPAGSDSENG